MTDKWDKDEKEGNKKWSVLTGDDAWKLMKKIIEDSRNPSEFSTTVQLWTITPGV